MKKNLLFVFILTAISVLLNLTALAQEQPVPSYLQNYESFKIGDNVVTPTANKYILYTVAEDPDIPGNKVGKVFYNNTVSETLASDGNLQTPLKGTVQLGFKIKYPSDATNDSKVQIQIKSQAAGAAVSKAAFKFGCGAVEGYNKLDGVDSTASLPNSSFVKGIWYDVRVIIDTETETYEVYRLKIHTKDADWERITPEGGYSLRAASTVDYNTYGISGVTFQMTGTAVNKALYYDDLSLGVIHKDYAPNVSSMLPADNALNVSNSIDKIRLNFSDCIIPNTVWGNIIVTKTILGNTTPADSEIEYIDSQGCTIKLNELPEFGAVYTVEVLSGILSRYGISMEPSTHSFTVESPSFKIKPIVFEQLNQGTGNSKVNVKFVFDNKGMTIERPILMMVAYYDENGYMEAGVYEKTTVLEYEIDKPFNLDLDIPGEIGKNGTVRVYIWDEFSKNIPLQKLSEHIITK